MPGFPPRPRTHTQALQQQLRASKESSASLRQLLAAAKTDATAQRVKAAEQAVAVADHTAAVARAEAAAQAADADRVLALSRASAARADAEAANAALAQAQAALAEAAEARRAADAHHRVELEQARQEVAAAVREAGQCKEAAARAEDGVLEGVRACFDTASSGVNGNGCTAHDCFQRIRQHFTDQLTKLAAVDDAWAATSSHLAKVAAESWLQDVQAHELQSLRTEVTRLRELHQAVADDAITRADACGDMGTDDGVSREPPPAVRAALVDSGSQTDAPAVEALERASSEAEELRHTVETLRASLQETTSAHDGIVEELKASTRAAVLDALDHKRAAAAAKTQLTQAQAQLKAMTSRQQDDATCVCERGWLGLLLPLITVLPKIMQRPMTAVQVEHRCPPHVDG